MTTDPDTGLCIRPVKIAHDGPGRPESMAAVVIGTTFAGRVTLWSHGAEQLFGWTRAQTLHRPVESLADWGPIDRDAAHFDMRSGAVIERSRHVVTASGRALRLVTRSTLIVGADGADEVLTHVETDTAVRHRPPVAERHGDLLIIGNDDGTVRSVGAAVPSDLGYGPQQLCGRPLTDLFHVDDLDGFDLAWAAAVSDPGRPSELSLRVRDEAGHWRQMRARLTRLTGALSPPGMVLGLRDVTEQHRLAVELRRNQSYLGLVFDAAQEGIWITAPDGQTVSANQRMATILNVAMDKLIGARFADVMDPAAAAAFERHHASRRAGVREVWDVSLDRLDGHRRTLRISGTAHYNQRGEWTAVVGLCTDLTAPGPEPTPSYSADPATAELEQLLSRRELEVVRQLQAGDRVPAIAKNLFVSQSTVRNYLCSAFRKLGVRSQQELIVRLRPTGPPSYY